MGVSVLLQPENYVRDGVNRLGAVMKKEKYCMGMDSR